jgi:hypothetical protein
MDNGEGFVSRKFDRQRLVGVLQQNVMQFYYIEIT